MFNIRRYSRIWCNEYASVSIGDKLEIEVRILNISLNGAFFRLKQDCKIRKGDSWQLSYPLPVSNMILRFNAEVVHSDDNFVGVKFSNVDRATMIHLCGFLKEKFENPQQLADEYSYLMKHSGTGSMRMSNLTFS